MGIHGGALAQGLIAAGQGRRLAGGPLAFTHVQVLERGRPPAWLPLAGLEAGFARWPEWREAAMAGLERLTAPRAPWAGLTFERTRIMGIVNVTPDSFSDGGAFLDPERAVAHGRALRAAGADIIDVGGESTRPGADPVAPEEEIRRVLPVVKALASGGALVSIDTRHAAVMEAALAAGARVINDVSALAGDPRSLAVAARSSAAVVLMHMGGQPKTMQDDPQYEDVTLDVYDFLAARIAACAEAGIQPQRILVDPGLGFGKTAAHNFTLLARLAVFHGLGTGILVGASRKSFLAKAGGDRPSDRLGASLAAALTAAAQGVQVLRVHDVATTREALALKDQIDSAI